MKILAGLIRRELRLQADKYGHCAVYEDELQRIWPINEENRKAKIAQFAKKNGFRLAYYKPGLCAIFEEQSVNEKPRTTNRKEWALISELPTLSFRALPHKRTGKKLYISQNRIGRWLHQLVRRLRHGGNQTCDSPDSMPP